MKSLKYESSLVRDPEESVLRWGGASKQGDGNKMEGAISGSVITTITASQDDLSAGQHSPDPRKKTAAFVSCCGIRCCTFATFLRSRSSRSSRGRRIITGLPAGTSPEHITARVKLMSPFLSRAGEKKMYTHGRWSVSFWRSAALWWRTMELPLIFQSVCHPGVSSARIEADLSPLQL